MNEPKIQLSATEAELMCNAEVILTKNIILQKVKALFEELQEEMVKIGFEKTAKSGSCLFENKPKISRGENYEGLPYIILDYPRIFEKENIFAIRTMFWWGNFFSTTLHLSGEHKQRHRSKIEQANLFLEEGDFYIGVNLNPWIHHFQENNYKKIAKENSCFKTQIAGADHLKIASKIPLTTWASSQESLLNQWKTLASICFD